MTTVVVLLSSDSKTPFMWSRVAIGEWTFFAGVTAGMPAHSDWTASGPGAHLDTATDLRCSGGHPACRRAGHLARRNDRSTGTWCSSGRQDAALYGRQDACRYMVAVSGGARGPDGHYRFLDLRAAILTMRASLRSRSDLGNRELTNGRKTGVSAMVTIGLPGFLSSGLNTNIYEHNPRHTGA
jgi:hypothetical protein